MPDDDDRYRLVLDEFSKFWREFQDFRLEREKASAEQEQRLTAHIQFFWGATAAALRQLSNWQAATEDEARKERTRGRQRAYVVIGLLVVLIIAVIVRGV